jgi:hypothetical protein
MKTKCVDGDPDELVTLIHKNSNGMCLIKDKDGDVWNLHKRHLKTPEALKSRPPKHPYVDPYIRMGQIAAMK